MSRSCCFSWPASFWFISWVASPDESNTQESFLDEPGLALSSARRFCNTVQSIPTYCRPLCFYTSSSRPLLWLLLGAHKVTLVGSLVLYVSVRTFRLERCRRGRRGAGLSIH